MTYLLDTNILVYAVDANEPDKQEKARALLRQLGGSRDAVLSAQSLGEFANVTLRRLRPPLPSEQVHRFAEQYDQAFRVLERPPSFRRIHTVAQSALQVDLHLPAAHVLLEPA